MLEQYTELLKQQSGVNTKRKAAQEELDRKIDAKYPILTEDEIKALVVNDKWMASLQISIQNEINYVSQMLTGRICQLDKRYVTPIPKLIKKVEGFATRVEKHLEKMSLIRK